MPDRDRGSKCHTNTKPVYIDYKSRKEVDRKRSLQKRLRPQRKKLSSKHIIYNIIYVCEGLYVTFTVDQPTFWIPTATSTVMRGSESAEASVSPEFYASLILEHMIVFQVFCETVSGQCLV